MSTPTARCCPATAIRRLKKYEHFYGHYGTAWQNQGKEFPAFPGAILMTTNCIQKPKGDSGEKIFTTGLVGWPGMPHIEADASGKKGLHPGHRKGPEPARICRGRRTRAR